MFEDGTEDGAPAVMSIVEPRLLALLAELESLPAITTATRTPSTGITRLSWNAPARCRSSPGGTRPGGMAGSTIRS